MELRLTANDVEIIEHRLSASTLGDVAADTYLPDDVERDSDTYLAAAEGVGSVSDRLLQQIMSPGAWRRPLVISTPVEAWCIAECVEGSTWVALTEGEFGRHSKEAKRASRNVESLRARLNASPEFVAILGREVRPIAALVEEAPATVEALRAALMADAK